MEKILKYYKVILASSSPRRRELLKSLISDFTIISPDVNEAEYGKYPSKMVIANALAKASAVEDEEGLIIAADTVVFMNGKYYLKPRDIKDAHRILSELSGKTHYVYTGVCLKQGDKTVTFYEKSAVKFKKVSSDTIADYIKTGSPLDKAGAYGIQDDTVVKSYKGSYSNIMGLPLEKLADALKEF